MVFIYRHILIIHKNIKSNSFLHIPPDSCSASPQVPLWWFSCCFTVSFFNNCIAKSRQMLFTLLYRHILIIHKKIKSNCFLLTPPDSCSASYGAPHVTCRRKKNNPWRRFCNPSPQFINRTHEFLNCSLGLTNRAHYEGKMTSKRFACAG